MCPLPCRTTNGTKGAEAMSDLAEGVETIAQSRADEPAQTRTYEERLQIAKRIVQVCSRSGLTASLLRTDCLRIAWVNRCAAR